MIRKIALISMIVVLPAMIFSQYAYIPEYMSGNLNLTDLTDPTNKTLVGTTVTNLGACDFGADNVLYGISGNDDGLYSIDTTNGTATLIATIPPGGSAFWSGMALDPTDGTMYICSTDGNTNSFYTLDVTNGNTTLIGTNSAGSGVVGIAFDDNGQMYAIYLVRQFYMIDKSNAQATLVGNMTNSPTAGMWHGLDFCSENQTMYMTAYNSFTFDNELYTIDLLTATNSLVGSVVVWAGSIATRTSFEADFSADNRDVCEGDAVNFTDETQGSPVSWEWTFEGGTPPTSTSQNPSVTYNTAGSYDVQLVVSDGNVFDTLVEEDYITVEAVPGQPSKPVGTYSACEGGTFEYTTAAVPFADDYLWEVSPTDAGTISGNGTTADFEASTSWTGTYSIRVQAANDCGTGAWSDTIQCTLNHQPVQYNLTGGGGYCEGGPGRELILDGSETGVDYELYLDDLSTGVILPGTGASLNFGYQTDEGFYTVTGYTVNCIQEMVGENYIFIQPLPGQPGAPNGADLVCGGDTTDYTTSGATNADNYTWTLSPQTAGALIPDGTDVEVAWDISFTGTAYLSVTATNDCGDGIASDELEIVVEASPQPQVSGEQLVCEGEVHEYITDDTPGNTYAWDVTGGTIVSGAGTSMISVEWGAPGTGTLEVTESNGACETASETFEVIIDECTSVGELSHHDIKIYPNPADELIHIDLSDARASTGYLLTIYNNEGRRIEQRNISKGETTINMNVSGFQAGLYLIRLESASGIISKRIIIR